ncbi:uncharacterized protein LOC131022959 [Salvia miltiorrhiza]|uniref:uncharacterized protein LOC131022959 n=1 Tax=Salvia miltiorrhiza TaxID=226208 RepID=UPI0025AD22D3|nr:uncharacterized protein LOC131022959 [Salvia miltiorrhiza]
MHILLLICVHKKLPENWKDWIETPFTEEEIRTAVWNCEGGKSPGPDGFNFNFFKNCWEIIKDDLFEVMRDFHSHGKLAKGSNPSFIALIPKKEGAAVLKEFRPISLINCLYKVISKVLASRLKQVMHLIIAECQSAFVGGRYILDGVIVLNEIIEETTKKKKGLALFKVDFARAYDTVDWAFLDNMLEHMNFGFKWRGWISGCLCSASANVLVNGSPSGEFRLERGLRQGDPLSPFLFLIVAEGLNLLVERAIHKGCLEPVSIGREEVRISHLQYADDTMFVVTEKRDNAWAIKCILKLFELLSGLSVNFDKSCIVGVGTSESVCRDLANTLKCQVGEMPINYLGIKIGKSLSRAVEWKYLVDKVKRRIAKWNNRKISFAGRVTLLRSVLTSIPIYQMSFSIINKSVISQIRSIVYLESFNKALMAKWIWRFLTEGNSLWARVVRACKGDLVWDEEGFSLEGNRLLKPGWWKNVLKLSWGDKGGCLRDNLKPQVGDGASFSFWNQIWVGAKTLGDLFPRLFRISDNQGGSIKTMGDWFDGVWEWKIGWNRELRGREHDCYSNLLAILSNVEIFAGKEDGWRWTASTNGVFTVKSAYSKIRESGASSPQGAVGFDLLEMWKAPAPFKAKTTAWRVLKGRLATCENLIRRQVNIPISETACVFCKEQTETMEHLFFKCQKSDVIWWNLLQWLGFESALPVKAREHFLAFSNLGKKSDSALLIAIWLCTIWSIWNGRNKCKFNQGTWNPHKLKAEIKSRVWGWSLAFKLPNYSNDFRTWITGTNILA